MIGTTTVPYLYGLTTLRQKLRTCQGIISHSDLLYK